MVTLLLISVLVGVLLERAVYYQERAEKAAMEQVAMDLRSSVNLRVAELVLENRFAELTAMLSLNPMELLVRKPPNYVGRLMGEPGAGKVPPGNWYYDHRLKEVVYCVDRGRNFVPDERGLSCVSWHVTLVRGAGDPSAAPQWARFELVRPYRWF